MSNLTRRTFVLAGGSAALAGCANGIGSSGAATIDARVASTVNFLHTTYPGTRALSEKAAGTLVMPLVTEAGLGLGGSFGRGALQVQGTTIDYYSAASASAGFQIGAQQYSHVLFFMTPEALADFRASPGWVLGADVSYAISDQGELLRADTTTALAPVLAVVFAQTGLQLGATLEGTKYTRIIP